VCKFSQKIVCTNFCHGKKHDFKLFKDSKVRWVNGIYAITDSGYLGMKRLQKTSIIPKKHSKKHPLTKEEKRENCCISAQRVLNENVIGRVKRFKILSDRYRNRRKRFGLRFNLIAAIYNLELEERLSKRLQKKENGY
jgi:DDE superfamily endonuclease